MPAQGLTIGSVFMSAVTAPTSVDAFGVDWGLTKLDGWWDGWAAPDSGVSQRLSSHGGHPDEVWSSPRVIHVDGTIKAASWDDATLAWRRLMSSVPLSDLTTMTVFTGAGAVLTEQADIRQHEKPVISDRFAGRILFSLSLIAPDSRVYSSTLQSASTGLPVTTGGLTLPITLPITINATTNSGRLSVTNGGNTASPAIFTITGPCPPCTITHITTGRRLVVVDAIDAGRTLTIDTDAHTALLDGTALRTVTGSWFQIEPGANEIAFSATAYDAGALLSISFRSAWK